MSADTSTASQSNTDNCGTPNSDLSVSEEWIPILVPVNRFADFLSSNVCEFGVRTPPMVARATSEDPPPPPLPTRTTSRTSEERSPKSNEMVRSDTLRRDQSDLSGRIFAHKGIVVPPSIVRNLNIELDAAVLEDGENNVDAFEVTGIRRYKGDGLWIVYKTAFEEGRKPLKSFIEGEYFARQEVCDLVNDWNESAKNRPNECRTCILCKNKAVKGKTICTTCVNQGLEQIVYG
jgi:hypothetical protein